MGTKTRGPKRSPEEIEADLKSQLARIETMRNANAWASKTATSLSGAAKTDLGDNAKSGLRALAKLLLAE